MIARTEWRRRKLTKRVSSPCSACGCILLDVRACAAWRSAWLSSCAAPHAAQLTPAAGAAGGGEAAHRGRRGQHAQAPEGDPGGPQAVGADARHPGAPWVHPPAACQAHLPPGLTSGMLLRSVHGETLSARRARAKRRCAHCRCPAEPTGWRALCWWSSARPPWVQPRQPPLPQGEKMVGGSGIKPPKLVEEDQERTYIPRPVGEQHRPPPPKPTQRRPT